MSTSVRERDELGYVDLERPCTGRSIHELTFYGKKILSLDGSPGYVIVSWQILSFTGTDTTSTTVGKYQAVLRL